jgi:hypothetical protein
LIYEIAPDLPLALADQELVEAVLTDLLARSLKYSDAVSPVVLGAERIGDRINLRITAQRFAPTGSETLQLKLSFAAAALKCSEVK